jgi:muramoyltetrapeptide carboxypeptidase
MDCWFCDITVLHNHLNTWDIKPFHGIMPITYPRATGGNWKSKNGLCLAIPYVTKLTWRHESDLNRFRRISRWKFINLIQFVRFWLSYWLYWQNLVYRRFRWILVYRSHDDELKNAVPGKYKRNCWVDVQNEGQWYSMGKNALQIIEDVTKQYNIPVVQFRLDISATKSVILVIMVHLDVSAKKVF